MLCSHFFGPLVPSKNCQKSPLFWNLKREPFITESISSPTVRKNKLVAKKKLTFIHLSSTTKIFLCPWAKLGPRAHHQQQQQVAGKIIMNINIILWRSHLTWQFLLAKNVMDFEEKRKRKHIYYQKFIISHFHL